MYGHRYFGSHYFGSHYFGPSDAAAVALTPALWTDTDNFYAPTVARGVRTLSPALYTDTDNFYAPRVSRTKVYPALWTDTDTFYAPRVSQSRLYPALYTDTDNFYAPRMGRGLYPALYTDGDNFYAPRVNISRVYPALYTDTDSFYAPRMGRSIKPALYTDTDTFYAPVMGRVLKPRLITGPVVFDANDHAPNIAISADGLTVTDTAGTADYSVARTTHGKSTGKWYFEGRIDVDTTANNVGVGLARFDSYLDDWLGHGYDNVGYFLGGSGNNDAIWHHGTNIADFGVVTAAPLYARFAVDLDTREIWVKPDGFDWNNNPLADPATGIGGVSIIDTVAGTLMFPATNTFSAGDQTTLRFENFVYTVPAGFLGWGAGAPEIDIFYAPELYPSAALHPDADITDGGWINEASSNVNLYASVDEVTPDDADYIRSGNLPVNDVVRLRVADPTSAFTEPFRVRYRYKKGQPTAGTMDLTARLLQGGTTIAEWTHNDITDSFVEASQYLTTPEFEAITDFTDLNIEFEATYAP